MAPEWLSWIKFQCDEIWHGSSRIATHKTISARSFWLSAPKIVANAAARDRPFGINFGSEKKVSTGIAGGFSYAPIRLSYWQRPN
ncbi:hypothetical protein, partial [Vibrio fluvialis]|uniref:hypothetical protein n=1 Tax=Vibrio fluvialis TaxID=676 RepID=UPI003D7EB2CA